MAMTPEGRVKKAIKEHLRQHGVWFTMPIGTGLGSSGVPDFLCCHNGRFVAIEAKAKGKRGNTSALQKTQISKIIEAGGVAVVVDDVSQLEGVFQNGT
ncbi:VRR-NUC domain-containing protein [bacterium]|nr:VRR-NUC domain-containing protein [bacterium]